MTVVLGVDNSAISKAALRLAAQEARWRQVPLVVVSAYEASLGPVGGYRPPRCRPKARSGASTEAEFRATVDDELGGQAGEAQLHVSEGLAGHVIIEAARQTHAQLVVLAARTGKPTVPGTVSQYVLLKARCPVTIVPSPAGTERPTDSRDDAPRKRKPAGTRFAEPQRTGGAMKAQVGDQLIVESGEPGSARQDRNDRRCAQRRRLATVPGPRRRPLISRPNQPI